MLALILVRKLRPMIIGSLSGWLMLLGMMARPRATSSRTNSGVMSFWMLAPKRLARMLLQQVRLADRLDALVLADRDELHLRRDDAAARVVHLRDVGAGDARDAAAGAARKRTASSCGSCLAARGRTRTTGPASTSVSPRSAIHCARSGARPRAEVDVRVGIGVRAGGVVDRERRVVLAAEHASACAPARSRASARGCRDASLRRGSCASRGSGG